ncbi:MAG: FAD-binding and (Fe-S)-binding domain-containing protein [Acidobacteriota bacterium]
MPSSFQAAYRWIDAEGRPPAAFEPQAASEAQRWIRGHDRPGQGILIAGKGKHWHLGNNPSRVTGLLSLHNCNQVVEYSPADMTATFEAGCSLQSIEQTLAGGGQFLPFLPFHSGDSTIGGAVSANLSGPWAGALGRCRDHLIGVEVLHPDGRLSHAGGKVVKNVAGYDLCKLYAGALGTLGVLTRLTFKVQPRPPSTCTLLLSFESLDQAIQQARQIRDQIFPAALEVLSTGPEAGMPYQLAVGLLDSEAVLEWKQERILEAQPDSSVLQQQSESAFWEAWSHDFGQHSEGRSKLPIVLVSAPLGLFKSVVAELQAVLKAKSFSASFLQGSLLVPVSPEDLPQRLSRFRRGWTGKPVFSILWKAPASLKQSVEVWDIPPSCSGFTGICAGNSTPTASSTPDASELATDNCEERTELMASKDPFSLNLDCIHCGLCLSACPTYQILGSETDSPRGRIYLMKAAWQGRIELDDKAVSHLDGCLACRACESACPSGVRFEWMLAQTRSEIRKQDPGHWLLRAAFQHLLPYPRRIRALAGLTRIYQNLGLQSLARRSGLLGVLSRGLAEAEGKLPFLPRSRKLKQLYPAYGERKFRVGFLSGCVMPVLFPHTHEASIEVLRRSGCEVVVPARQSCCGALHWHDGRADQAKQLARQLCQSFEGKGLDALIVNSAGCGAAMKDYGHWLQADPDWRQGASDFSRKVEDLCEFLVRINPPWQLAPLNIRLAYDDPCHLLHGQKISSQPRLLLKRIPGLELLDFPNPDRCCGAAGIYNLLQPALSNQLTGWKCKEILSSRPDRVATANPGCMMQIRAGLHSAGASLAVQHPVEILQESLKKASAANSKTKGGL